ncbi:MAG: isoprenylcysteine carboxylmethyltransferase family protein [Lachnospiraceae bacterium]|nr:isoprenylcysteine carboxylmethyltransferase family protein [Lachnospiraceae bacterium]
MIYRIAAIMILAAFYLFYFAKIVIQKHQSIKTNQMGVGKKPRKVLVIERVMSVATVLTVIFEVWSIIWSKGSSNLGLQIAGVAIGIAAVVIFALATIAMKNSWRVGIPEEKTSLITNGIYGWSRNPAFVGFDLLYLSVCLMFFNIPLLLVSTWAAVMLHLQILQEEEHMQKMFGEDYVAYCKKVNRCIPWFPRK